MPSDHCARPRNSCTFGWSSEATSGCGRPRGSKMRGSRPFIRADRMRLMTTAARRPARRLPIEMVARRHTQFPQGKYCLYKQHCLYTQHLRRLCRRLHKLEDRLSSPQGDRTGGLHQIEEVRRYNDADENNSKTEDLCPFFGARDISAPSNVAEEGLRPSG